MHDQKEASSKNFALCSIPHDIFTHDPCKLINIVICREKVSLDRYRLHKLLQVRISLFSKKDNKFILDTFQSFRWIHSGANIHHYSGYAQVLKMHDCILTVTGLLVSIGSSAVFGTATRGWMMYYGASITVLGALDSTPIRSLVSKMVEPDEYGKVFTFTATSQAISSLVTSSVYQLVYKATLDTYPGALFLVAAGMLCIAVVISNF